MKKIITLIIFIGLAKNLFGLCATDERTLTEMLFKGQAGVIFTCEILTMTTPKYDNGDIVSVSDGIDGTATVKIIQVFFGKVDSNIITLKTGSNLQIGKTYIIYTSGTGKVFSCGGICDKWTKKVDNSSLVTCEMQLLKQFSKIFKNRKSGKYIFKNIKGIVIATGEYKKGKPIKVWKHYYDNGLIKTEYDLEENITSAYSTNGFIKSKSSINKNVSIYELYSSSVYGRITYKVIETKNDTLLVSQSFEYYENGKLKTISGQVSIEYKNSSSSIGKTGIYEEYYENGKLQLKGQYEHNRRIGVWKWYFENGEYNTEFDYKDGTGGQ